MHRAENTGEHRIAHPVQQPCAHLVRLVSAPSEGFDEQHLQKALQDHVSAGIVVPALIRDEVDDPAQSLRTTTRRRDMDDAGKQREQERGIGLLYAKGAAERDEIGITLLLAVADRSVAGTPRRAFHVRMAAEGEGRRRRQQEIVTRLHVDGFAAVERDPALALQDDREARGVVRVVANAPPPAAGDRLRHGRARPEESDDVAEGIHLDDP